MLLPQRRRFLFDDFDRDIGRLFGELTPASCVRQNGETQASWSPALDIEETEQGLTLHLDLPGIPTDKIDVHVEEGSLVISGERQSERREESGKLLRVERRTGKFERRLQLPKWADVAGITAQGKNGELSVHIPRAEQSKARKIEVH